MNPDLRATAEYLFQLADEARARGNLARASSLEQIAEDYEAEFAAQERRSATTALTGLPSLKPA